MKKNIFLPFFACLMALSGLVFAHKVFADYSETTMDGLKSVSLLGIPVSRSASIKFSLLDVTNQTSTTQTFTLPTLTNNNGMIYIIRVIDRELEGNFVTIKPASGQKLDDDASGIAILGDSTTGIETITLIADENHDTWLTVFSTIN